MLLVSKGSRQGNSLFTHYYDVDKLKTKVLMYKFNPRQGITWLMGR